VPVSNQTSGKKKRKIGIETEYKESGDRSHEFRIQKDRRRDRDRIQKSGDRSEESEFRSWGEHEHDHEHEESRSQNPGVRNQEPCRSQKTETEITGC
jgi:hypothetical protein